MLTNVTVSIEVRISTRNLGRFGREQLSVTTRIRLDYIHSPPTVLSGKGDQVFINSPFFLPKEVESLFSRRCHQSTLLVR